MLEQIIIRKPFLKKHMAAPLLKERESFLTMKSKEGLSRLTLMGWAGYSLKFIQYFDLHDGKKRIDLYRLPDGMPSDRGDERNRSSQCHRKYLSER